uniref:Uncharacterized protein n=1 Tax=Arundo donax TaxID=35708 RepID=A0A0A9BIQ4_ARUDO
MLAVAKRTAARSTAARHRRRPLPHLRQLTTPIDHRAPREELQNADHRDTAQ